jgi:two-component system, sensor histidine kinase and response regulator
VAESDSNASVSPAIKRVVWSLCFLPLLLAASSFLGWTLEISVLKNPFPDQPPVAPTTAISLVCCVAAILLLTGKRAKSLLSALLALTAMTISGLILVHYAFNGFDLDQLFSSSVLRTAHGYSPGRMAPNTGIALLLISAACLASSGTRTYRLFAQILTGLLLILASSTFIGYLFAEPKLYGVGIFTPMALPTAAALTCMGMALLATHIEFGVTRLLMSNSEGGFITRALLPAAIILPIVLGYLRLTGERLGLFSQALGVALMVLAMIVLFSLFVIGSALYIERISSQREKSFEAIKLLYGELLELRDRAVEGARLKSEFLANMSHEIRTPMNAVIGCADMLCRTSLSVSQKRFVDIITTSGRALLDIINDILLLSKIEAGKFELQAEEIDLTELAESCIDVLAERAREKRISLTSFVSPEINTTFIGDSLAIRQVLTNLLSNAVKFTDSGSVTLRVTAENAHDGEQSVRFVVADTGIGISPESLNKLFQPFIQADGSTTRKFGGTGLGLAISRKLVELMGGEISVESTVGVGATFGFQLAFQKSGSATKRNLFDLNGARLLVVGTPINEFEVIRSYCQTWRVQADYCPDLKSAVHLFQSADSMQKPHHIILCDASTGDIDTFVAKIRAKSKTTRLVILAELDQIDHIDKSYRWGFDALISKTLRQSDLFDQVATAAFPQLAPDQRVSDKAVPPSEGLGRALPSDSNKRILLVEDNPINQEVAKFLLQELGFDSVVCSNGKEALEKLDHHRYPLVLMDCQMPEMDGFQAASAIRQREAGSTLHTPVIAMTANAMEGDRDKCLQAGMDDYISKPVTREQLKSIIEKWFLVAMDDEEPSADSQPTLLEESWQEIVQPLEKIFGSANSLKLLDMFIRETPKYLARLERAIEAHDSGGIAGVAHALRGTALTLRLNKIATIGSSLESCAQDFIVCTNEVVKLRDEITRVRSILKPILTFADESEAAQATATLIVVEDNAVTREALVCLISRIADFEIIGQSDNGLEAVELVQEKRPAAVLFDIDLPGLSGIDAVKRIKSKLSDVKVLMLTSHDSNDELFAAFAAGADGYVLKHNFDQRQLELAVRTVLGGNCWLDPTLAQRILQVAVNAKQEQSEAEGSPAAVLSADDEALLRKLAEDTEPACTSGLCVVDASFLSRLHRLHPAKLANDQ